MKKIIITNEQVSKLMNNIINEQYDDRSRTEVTCDFDYHKLTYKGGEIADISDTKFIVTYDVEPEWRSYGIKSIYVSGIRGPEEIEVEVSTFTDELNDDYAEEYITLKLDWESMLNVNEDETLGFFGVSPYVTIVLENDNEGGLRAKLINLDVRKF